MRLRSGCLSSLEFLGDLVETEVRVFVLRVAGRPARGEAAGDGRHRQRDRRRQRAAGRPGPARQAAERRPQDLQQVRRPEDGVLPEGGWKDEGVGGGGGRVWVG